MSDLQLVAIWQHFADAQSTTLDAILARRDDRSCDLRPQLAKALEESRAAQLGLRQLLAATRKPKP